MGHNSAMTNITRQKMSLSHLHFLIIIHAKYQVIQMETEEAV